jgi:uncharacterized phage protein (TIGR02218 family)
MTTYSRPVFEVNGLNFIQVLNTAGVEVKPWAHFIKIATDLETIGFTSLDRAVTIEGIVYYPNTAISPSSVKKSAAIESNNFDVKGLIDSEMLSDIDLRAGKYNDAKVTVFIGNFLIGSVVKVLAVGRWGQVKKTDQTWEVTIRTTADILNQSVFQSLSRNCRYLKRLQDPRCGVNIASYTTNGTVTSVTGFTSGIYQFIISATNFPGFGGKEQIYNWQAGAGYVRFLTGNNAGYKLPIREVFSSGGSVGINILQTPPYAVNIGDTLELIPGCDGSMVFCRYKFNNAARYGGIADGAHYFPTKEQLRR